MLTPTEGLALILGYGIVLTLIVLLTKGTDRSSDRFLVVNRNLGIGRGALSIAAAWIWAPAIFICSLKSYTQGLPGIFWFTFPNILCFFVFTPLALRLRKLFPHGYTWPDYIWMRFKGNRAMHQCSLVIYFGYQLGAVMINSLAGGTLLHLLTGLDFPLAVILMSTSALIYTLISGFHASVITDVIQMVIILFIALVLVPWVTVKAGGAHVIAEGFGGASGKFGNIFDPAIAYSFGIAATFGLISGPIADQMFFQRAFAARKDSVAGIFILGGLVFGIVPIVLSLLGFIGAAPSVQGQITVSDPQMIGPIVVGHFLPKWALMAFCVMAFAGLSSTLDSCYCAASSLGSVDIFRRYFRPGATDAQMVRAARVTMLICYVIGTCVALMKPKLLWLFLIYGALASAALFPTIFSLYSRRLTARGAFWAVLLSIALGTPLSMYANIKENTDLIVLSAIASVAIGLVICLVDICCSKERFDFDRITENEPH